MSRPQSYSPGSVTKKIGRKGILAIALASAGCFTSSLSQAITVDVVGWDRALAKQRATNPAINPEVPVPGFRWVLEEDNSHPVTPGVAGATDMLALEFHASHAPVILSGQSSAGSTSITVPLAPLGGTRYFLSVLPFHGFSMGGIPVTLAQDNTTVKIVVNKEKIPTAQISVFAYEDHYPLNNAPSNPAAINPTAAQANNELGLVGFDVLLIDGAGLYGQAGGQVIVDAFGNPLGTTYQKNPLTNEPLVDPVTGDFLVQTPGTGVLKTGADGTLTISNLVPAKYGIQMVPPPGTDWQQTHTIEGSKTIDAWVKPNEPAFFQEFGPPGHHVFTGFVSPSRLNNAARNGTSTVTGQVVNNHMSRPPNYSFFPGDPMGNCWVGVNPLPLNSAEAIYAGPCNPDGSFSIPGLLAGQSYQLVIWDKFLFNVFASQNFSIPASGTSIDLGQVAVFSWFGRLFNTVFLDTDGDGFMDSTEQGIPEQNINLRFRNGALYRGMPTDLSGESPFEEVFPFFHWLVAEVDYARFKATGITYVVDAGGEVRPDGGWADPTFDMANPQPQFETDPVTGLATATPLVNPNTGNNLSRTIRSVDAGGPVLTMAYQQFLGQTSFLQWGKAPYGRTENGGISGIVYYATTRAETQPQFAAAEEWESGVPRVQVALYPDVNRDGLIDAAIVANVNTRAPIYADVDNYPLGWSEGGAMSAEDIDRNGNGAFDLGDAIQVVHTDSFDDSQPTGCQGPAYSFNGKQLDCYDGLRSYNQLRPGVFDGGYAFNGINAGDYIVEASTPPGYQLLKEEDKNVDFGEGLKPAPELLAATCVGDLRRVPKFLSMQTDTTNLDADGDALPYAGIVDPIAAPYAGVSRPLCDRKLVHLVAQTNAAADFYLFTDVPKAARVVGFMLNDLANEFDPNAPTFGEKLAPSWLPVSIKDWTGREIQRIYSDEFGKYNALLPSTFTMNAPMPSGVGPNMITACMNDLGPVLNPNYNPADPISQEYIPDPYFNRQFTQFCYTFQFMPGTTTYLDTPVLPIAAFAANGSNPVDCECVNHTPRIYRVDGAAVNSGPIVPTTGGVLNIVSMGTSVTVSNPAYIVGSTEPRTILRDYGFGTTPGTVTLGGTALTVALWTEGLVSVNVPAGLTPAQLLITRGDNGKATESGITIHRQTATQTVRYAAPTLDPLATPIQDAINSITDLQVSRGALVLIQPGVYNEMVIMDRPIKLQGFGSGSVTINAKKIPAEKLEAWRIAIDAGYRSNQFSVLPGQADALGVVRPDNEPGLFAASEGPGIIVLGAQPGNALVTSVPKFNNNASLIDGISITGGDAGGAIIVNGYANNLVISNTRLMANQGTYNGGIRVGDPFATSPGNGNGYNNGIRIHHNEILENGGLFGAGGGVSLYDGSTNYQVTENRICGNFSSGHGGGIGHSGRSNGGRIVANRILFNQSFSQMNPVNGGGVFISGTPAITGLTTGAGNVNIHDNLIQGNNAGAGDGGGIHLQLINGTESGANATTWYSNSYGINILDNIIVNNVAGYAGGGISMADAVKVNVVNNTIANNDTTATTGSAVAEGPNANTSVSHVAGIASYVHSQALNFAIPSVGAAGRALDRYRGFAKPRLANNIIWENRAHYWQIVPSTDPAQPDSFGLVFDGFQDLGVLPAGIGSLTTLASTQNNLITNATTSPAFLAPYHNGSRGQTVIIPEFTTSIATAAALDEGGNMIDVAYGPLTLDGGNTATGGIANDGNVDNNYHIGVGSAAINAGLRLIDGVNFNLLYTYGTPVVRPLLNDFDGQLRPYLAIPSQIDIGADERQ